MSRIASSSRALVYMALTAVACVGVASCSSDDNKTTIDDLSTIDVSLPPSATLPVGLPGSEECQAVYVQFITAMTSAYTPGDHDFSTVFGDLSAKVPADLQDDMAILTTAFQQYGQILATHNNDSSTPEVQAAIAALQTPEVSAAGQAVTSYFEQTCPEAI